MQTPLSLLFRWFWDEINPGNYIYGINTRLRFLCLGSFQKLVVGGEQPGKVLEMITCGRLVDWNSDLVITGQSFPIYYIAIQKVH